MEIEYRDGIPAPRPDDPDLYLNHLLRPANDVMKEYVEGARKLDVIPIADGYTGEFVTREWDPEWTILMRKMVEMGWPDRFRVKEWREMMVDFYREAGRAVERDQEADKNEMFDKDVG